MSRVSLRFVFLACIALGSLSSLSAQAAIVPAGFDYLVTLPGTFFSSPFGPIPLTGVPINPILYGPTDTIVERQANAVFPFTGGNLYPGPAMPGTDVVIPIELVALELKSVAPISVGTSFFDVFVTLDIGTPSVGTMTIRHEWADSGDPNPEGTFDSFFDVFVNVEFDEIGGPGLFTLPVHLTLSSSGNLWTHDPFGFGILGPIVETHPGMGVHVAQPVPGIPEVSSVLMVGIGALVGGLFLRTR